MRKTMTSAVMIAALASGCASPQAAATKAPRPVRAQMVREAPAPAAVRYSATIEPREQVTLAFKTSGYVDALLQRPGADGRPRAAQAGDPVARGTVLARVRDADYRERVAQGRARVAEAHASLTRARLDLDRATALFAAASLVKPDLDAAQAAHDAADARVAAATAELALATLTLRDCELIAPAGGVLLDRKIEVGTLVSAGAPGFVIGDMTSVKARFGIPDGMIPSIHAGQAIEVFVEASGPATLTGRITAIAPAADPQSRVFDVEITIPNRDCRLRPGMIGTVSVPAPAGTRTPGVTVPLTAVIKAQSGTGSYAVLVIERRGDATIVHTRHVELGDVVGNAITVLKGLGAGDTVVVTGANLLADGEPVRVVS